MMMDRVGQQFGNYRLLRLLGRGGFAEVYLGEHVHLGTEAAIKILHKMVVGEEAKRFRDEAYLIFNLHHGHIVQLLDYGVEGDIPFLVMRHASNGSLRGHYQEGEQLSVAVINDYVQQIAIALQYAHDHHVIHRDVKPGNVLVGTDGTLLLSDFGLAILMPVEEPLSTQVAEGTLQYMSPEAFEGRPTRASDQYALGIMAYEWLCGRRPFSGPAPLNYMHQHQSVPPPPIRPQRPDLPQSVDAVVQKALRKNPAQRFASVQAFAQAFDRASQQRKPPPPWYLVALAIVIPVVLFSSLLTFFLLNRLPTLQSGPTNYTALQVTPLNDISPELKIGIAHGDHVVFDTKGSGNGEKCIDDTNKTLPTSTLTIIAVTVLSTRTNQESDHSLSIGDEELQGICLEQKKFNSEHPQTPLRVLTANLGTKEPNVLTSSVPNVAAQIIQFAHDNANFMGVVGFSFSQSVRDAMDKLNAERIPVISPAASSANFSNKWPFFYRVVPSNETEGTDAAIYARYVLHAQKAFVFLDTKNDYTGPLAQSFIKNFNQVNSITELYTISDQTSFKVPVQDMLNKYPTNSTAPVIIFCSCYASDFSYLRKQLTGLPSNVIFMGGEALYELGSYDDNYSNFYMFTFAYPDTIGILCPLASAPQTPQCTQEQQNFAQQFTVRPGPHVIQAYDAASALFQAYDLAHAKNNSISRQDVQQAFSQLAFEGISGYIDFKDSASPGDPKDKAILVLYVNGVRKAGFKCFYGQFLSVSAQNVPSSISDNMCR